jgi:hypothetical protein
MSSNWVARRRPWKSLTTAVMATTSVVWVPQAEFVAASSGAFVSDWAGPIVSRQFQFQAVAKPAGEPVADPAVETPFGWRQQYSAPIVRPSRVHLAEGVSQPLGEVVVASVAWQRAYAAPVVKVSRVSLADGGAWAPQIIAAETPSVWWGDRYGEPRFTPHRLAGLNGYDRPLEPVADPEIVEETSGAFESPWDGPVLSRAFQYQAISRPVPQIPVAETPAVWWGDKYGEPRFTPSRLAQLNGYDRPLEPVAQALTPDVWWGDKYGTPYFPPTRVALLNGYAKPIEPVADPVVAESSGAFTSSWDGPVVARQFQYQGRAGPVFVPPSLFASLSSWDGPEFSRAFLYEEMAAFVRYPEAVAGATTPSELGWQRDYAEPIKVKPRQSGDVANVFTPPTVSIGWYRSFDPPLPKGKALQSWQTWPPVEAPAVTPSTFGWHRQIDLPPPRRYPLQYWTAWAALEPSAVTPSTFGWQQQFAPAVARKRQAPPTWPGWFNQPIAEAQISPDLGWWFEFRHVHSKRATPWFYPSDFYTVGQTDGGTDLSAVANLSGAKLRTRPLGYRMRARHVQNLGRTKYPPEFWELLDNTPRDKIEAVLEQIEKAIEANEAGKAAAAKASVKGAQAEAADLPNNSALASSLQAVFSAPAGAGKAARLEAAHSEATQVQTDIEIQLDQDEEDILNILLADDED